MNYYEKMWEGDFGVKYTQRCAVDYKPRVEIFRKLFKGLKIESVLEVGCNLGHNLQAIQALGERGRYVQGIDINQYAIDSSPIKFNLKKASIFNTGYKDGSFDMVFSAGVLIHQHADQLTEAIMEMYRVARKYVMMIEYPNTKEVGRRYRDFQEREGVWSRPYGEIFKGLFPSSKLLNKGHMKDLLNDGWGFSKDCDYWVFGK